ncbi:MAG: ankyrin repeat domain-containing protein [Acidobacteriota bacterium]
MTLTNTRPNLAEYSILILLFSLLPGMLCCTTAGDNSALYQAIHKADVATVRRLLDQGANPDSNLIRPGILERPTSYSSKTPPAPLVVAIVEKQPEIVRVLLEKGAKVNFKDDAGFTPLEHAMSEGNPEIIGALLESGASRLNPATGTQWCANMLSGITTQLRGMNTHYGYVG